MIVFKRRVIHTIVAFAKIACMNQLALMVLTVFLKGLVFISVTTMALLTTLITNSVKLDPFVDQKIKMLGATNLATESVPKVITVTNQKRLQVKTITVAVKSIPVIRTGGMVTVKTMTVFARIYQKITFS